MREQKTPGALSHTSDSRVSRCFQPEEFPDSTGSQNLQPNTLKAMLSFVVCMDLEHDKYPNQNLTTPVVHLLKTAHEP